MGINKIRISAVFMVFCCMLSPLSAFADNLDYSYTDGVISGSQAPTAAELREQMEEAWEKGNVQKMKEIAAADYSTYVAKTDNISVDVHESNQWRLNKEVFGVEYEFVDEYDRYYENGELKRSYLDMQQSGRAGKIPVIRFGGGASAAINMIHTMQFAERFEMFLESTAHYIFLSTYRVYADKETPIREISPRLLDATTDMQYLSTEEYGLFKARCENILRASKYNNWTIVRPAITYSKYRFQLTTLEAYVFVRRCRQGLPSIVPEDALNVQATMSWGEMSER